MGGERVCKAAWLWARPRVGFGAAAPERGEPGLLIFGLVEAAFWICFWLAGRVMQ